MGLPAEMNVAAFMAEEELASIRELLQDEGIATRPAASVDELTSLAAPVILLDADGGAGSSAGTSASAPNDWLRVLQEIRARCPQGRVVVVSRLADNRMWVDTLRLGAFDLLAKPYRRQELCATVLGALNSGPADPAPAQGPGRAASATTTLMRSAAA